MEERSFKIITDPNEICLHDESYFKGKAKYFFRAENKKELVDAVKYCYEHGLTMTFQGSRTSITGASAPLSDVVFDLSCLNHILGMRKSDGTYRVIVEAGLTLGDLQAALAAKSFETSSWDEESRETLRRFTAEQRQVFPITPTETMASLGGMFMCNAGGMDSDIVGSMVDSVEAVELLTADGRLLTIRREDAEMDDGDFSEMLSAVIRDHSMAHSAVIGRFLPEDGKGPLEFLAGTEGVYGVVTELTLTLCPAAEGSWGILAFFFEEDSCAGFCEKMLQRPLAGSVLIGLEFYDQKALQIITAFRKETGRLAALPEIDQRAAAAVYLELAERDPGVSMEDDLFDILELLTEYGVEEQMTWAGTGRTEINKFRDLRHVLPQAVNEIVARKNSLCPEVIKLSTDFQTPKRRFREWLNRLRTDARREELPVVIFGHVRRQHLHCNFLCDDAAQVERAKELICQWARMTLEDGGRIMSENGIGKTKRYLVDRFASEEEKRELIAIKRMFDEKWLLNPGNVLSEDALKSAKR